MGYFNSRLNEAESQFVCGFGEIMSVEFFKQYKEAFDASKLLLEHQDLSDEELHISSQLLFSRLLLLKFLETLNWFSISGISEQYLQRLVAQNGIGKESVYNSRLRPLFFEALSNSSPFESTIYGKGQGLGGGLFKKTPLDERLIDIPDKLLESVVGVDGILSRFEFSVDESVQHSEDTVTPEMLGTLFEELVTGRHEQGAYYTPAYVVSYMSKESIKRYLSGNGIEISDELSRTIDHSEPYSGNGQQILELLQNVKIIDPACGSGAYLVGFINQLMQIFRALFPDASEAEIFESKKHFVSKCIFGVDLEEYAVQIAQLRMWLSLISEAVDPMPLPHIDLNIVVGDSISGPNPGKHYLWPADKESALKIGELRQQCMFLWGFEESNIRKEMSVLQTELEKKISSKSPGGAIKYEIQFAEVFAEENGGFDIVLANPPYVRQESIPEVVKKWIKKQEIYGSVITGKSDLYAYFFARTKYLLKQGGVSCFICSNTWMDVEFGFLLQNEFLVNYHDIHIIDTRIERQFATAEINTVISFMTRGHVVDEAVRFTMLEGPFEQSIEAEVETKVWPPLEQYNSQPDMALRTEQEIPKSTLTLRGTPKQDYVGSKWSLILNAPALYHNLVENHHDKFVSIQDMCSKTQRNNMEVLHSETTKIEEPAGEHENRVSFLHSFKDTSSIVINLSNQKSLQHAHIQTALAHENFVLPNIISNRFFGKRIYFIHGQDYFVNDSFFVGTINQNIDHKKAILSLNSTLSLMFAELRGRKGQGGGVLSFYGPEFRGHNIIKPELLTSLTEAHYSDLTSRDMNDVFVECGFDEALATLDAEDEAYRSIRSQTPNPLSDRKALDDIVFDVLELSQEQRNEVYWTLCESVLNRHKKSKSV
jgi:hypothetical protein